MMSERELTGTRAQYWQEKGLNKGGFLVCKYAFVVSRPAFRSTNLLVLTVKPCVFSQRLPDQPPIAVKRMDEEEADELQDTSTEESDAEETVASED